MRFNFYQTARLFALALCLSAAPLRAQSFDPSTLKVEGSNPASLSFSRFHDGKAITLDRFGLVPGRMSIRTSNTDHWPTTEGTMDRDGQAGTLWVGLKVNGEWYVTGAERLRKYQVNGDKPEAVDGGKISDLVGSGWLYDSNRWPHLAGHNPQPGEAVVIGIVSGSTRSDDAPTVRERTNFKIIAWPNDNGADPVAVLFDEANMAPATADVIATLRVERAKYPTPMSKPQLAAMLNATALAHKGEGWGLLGKPGGNNCPLPVTGTPISCDWLVNKQLSIGCDALSDQEGAASVLDCDGASYDGANFVSPVGDTPPVVTPPGADPDVALLKAQVERLDSEVGTLTIALDQLRQAYEAMRANLSGVAAQAAAAEASTQRIDSYLSAHPIPVTCRASAFGFGLSCSLGF